MKEFKFRKKIGTVPFETFNYEILVILPQLSKATMKTPVKHVEKIRSFLLLDKTEFDRENKRDYRYVFIVIDGFC